MRYFLILTISVLALSAHSESKEPAKKNVQYRKTQEVSFDASEVDGAVRTPDGAYVNPKKSVKFMPLYKVDQHFDKEIKDSVEYLK